MCVCIAFVWDYHSLQLGVAQKCVSIRRVSNVGVCTVVVCLTYPYADWQVLRHSEKAIYWDIISHTHSHTKYLFLVKNTPAGVMEKARRIAQSGKYNRIQRCKYSFPVVDGLHCKAWCSLLTWICLKFCFCTSRSVISRGAVCSLIARGTMLMPLFAMSVAETLTHPSLLAMSRPKDGDRHKNSRRTLRRFTSRWILDISDLRGCNYQWK